MKKYLTKQREITINNDNTILKITILFKKILQRLWISEWKAFKPQRTYEDIAREVITQKVISIVSSSWRTAVDIRIVVNALLNWIFNISASLWKIRLLPLNEVEWSKFKKQLESDNIKHLIQTVTNALILNPNHYDSEEAKVNLYKLWRQKAQLIRQNKYSLMEICRFVSGWPHTNEHLVAFGNMLAKAIQNSNLVSHMPSLQKDFPLIFNNPS